MAATTIHQMTSTRQSPTAQNPPGCRKATCLRKRSVFAFQLYGMKAWADLFTPRQLVALTTFSDLVAEVRQQVEKDAIAAGLVSGDGNLREMPESATGADFNLSGAERAERSGAERSGANERSQGQGEGEGDLRLPQLCGGPGSGQALRPSAVGMSAGIRQGLGTPSLARRSRWSGDYAESNPFSGSTGNWTAHINWIAKALETLPAGPPGQARQQDAGKPAHTRRQ